MIMTPDLLDAGSVANLLQHFLDQAQMQLNKMVHFVSRQKYDQPQSDNEAAATVTKTKFETLLTATQLDDGSFKMLQNDVNTINDSIMREELSKICRNSSSPLDDQIARKVGPNDSDIMKNTSPSHARVNLNFIDVPRNAYVDAQLSYVYSSRNFYVHLDYKAVELFSINLNNFYVDMAKRSLVNHFAVIQGIIYCAFNSTDGNYYRVEIIEILSLKRYKALLIDFGEILIFDKNCIFELPQLFAKAPAFAINCFLDGCWNNNLQYLDNFFHNLFFRNVIENVKIKAKFFEPLVDFKYPVSLMMRGEKEDWNDIFAFVSLKLQKFHLLDVIKKFTFFSSDFLKDPRLEYSHLVIDAYSRFHKTKFPKTKLILQRIYKAICPYVCDPSNFICVLFSLNESTADNLYDPECFTTNLSNFYRNSLIARIDSIVSESSIVVFQFDIFFFRGFIISIDGDLVRVFSIDFGFLVRVPPTQIFPLVEMLNLEHYPMFSLLCSLDGVVPNQSEIATELFRNLTENQILHIKPTIVYYAKGLYALQINVKNIDLHDALIHV